MSYSQINHALFPPVFPESWASSWGEDDYGLWMILSVDDVEQLFRWIEPGRFEMGSPIKEKQREDDEKQHAVILTEGYWLADTACMQKLWKAVMVDNPAHFTESSNNPVEQVSWEDVHTFIKKLNNKVPELTLGLPTEAQWEYACRANTTTPFNVGENITTDEVNYDGDLPYNNGKKGEYRKKSVAVKSMQTPNAWGLHEMHGNVWEWCQDWYGAYPEGEVENPKGVGGGSERVLRGGSWILSGRDVRSARRLAGQPALRDNYIGFRLSGQSSKKAS